MSGPIRMDLTTAELINSFKDFPADFAPGTDWAYNNSGYILLGAILESVSGVSWHEHLQQTFFTPHELNKTEFGGNQQLILDMASGYTSVAIKGGGGSNLAPAEYVSMTQPHAAGALISSPEELLRWNRLLHGGKLLNTDTYQQMISPQGNAEKHQYGFGIMRSKLRGQTLLEHGGGIHGFSSYLLYIPESQIGVAIIQNSDTSLSEISHSELALRIAAFALGKPFLEPMLVEVDTKTLSSFQGRYQLESQDTLELRLINDTLTAKRSGGTPIPLSSIGEDRFLFPNGLDSLQILKQPNGNISGLQLIAATDELGQFATLSDVPLSEGLSAVENVTQQQKQRILGNYRGAPGLLQVVINVDGKIQVQLQGQEALEAHPQTADLYFLTVNDATLKFAPGERAPSVTLSQGGRTAVLERAVE